MCIYYVRIIGPYLCDCTHDRDCSTYTYSREKNRIGHQYYYYCNDARPCVCIMQLICIIIDKYKCIFFPNIYVFDYKYLSFLFTIGYFFTYNYVIILLIYDNFFLSKFLFVACRYICILYIPYTYILCI